MTDPNASSTSTTEPSVSSPSYAEDEVSLLDILLVLARHKTLIMRTMLVFFVFGTTYALLADEEYTSTAKVVREVSSEASSLPGGLSSLSGSFGINLGSAEGLTPEAFPDILTSREVRLAVVRDTFYIPSLERRTTLVEYYNQPPDPVEILFRYTLKLPWTIKDALFADHSSSDPSSASANSSHPTTEELEAIKAISNQVTSSVDRESGLMTIQATAEDPSMATHVTARFLDELTARVRALRTQKVRENVEFMEDRFADAQQELRVAEDRLARFLERNQRIGSPPLQFERDRLRRQVGFKEQLYRDLQAQLTQARVELQRQQPVVTVVEEPVQPLERSAPKRALIVVLSLILGGFVGIGTSFGVAFVDSTRESKEEKEKMDEIKSSFIPERWRHLTP
jgi:uncharacterized protein involved in exopolysaccharide biosynthesis